MEYPLFLLPPSTHAITRKSTQLHTGKMCGGIREFEVLHSADSVRTVISQFQQEIKPSGYGYDKEADDADFPCYISSMNSWIPTLIAEMDCTEKKAAPVGLHRPCSLPQWIAQMEQLKLWWRPSPFLSLCEMREPY
ncbi:hypothetical protein KP509_02G108400 [Ceratopteris richardii]|uniref:Uncharacterized protein n=1 Tax=Ceratopteris richardii TaxID=49495 RepID=A0A8T2VD32_CERRI|nr:hypothetical protein KP509_02G108400 [Ceratopteris richardii]